MCIYHTYHWRCCPGTASPAPYFMHVLCETAGLGHVLSWIGGVPLALVGGMVRRCEIQHRILDGAEHGVPCPRCGSVALTDEEERLEERVLAETVVG